MITLNAFMFCKEKLIVLDQSIFEFTRILHPWIIWYKNVCFEYVALVGLLLVVAN